MAHTLRGEAATLGVREVQALCAELEQLAREGTLAAARELVEALDRAFERARAALEPMSVA